MRSRLLAATLLLAIGKAAAQTEPASLDIYVTLASDYLNRGLSQTDGDPALQLGVDYRHGSGFFTGFWASNVDFAAERYRERPRQRELDYYLGFNDRHDNWSWSLTLAHYAYPSIAVDYDYNELSFAFVFKERFFYQASYSDDLLSRNYSALNQEAGLQWPLARNYELGLGLGRFSSSRPAGGGFTHFNVGLSKIVRRFALDLRYYDTDYALTTGLGGPPDSRWVLSLSYGFSPI